MLLLLVGLAIVLIVVLTVALRWHPAWALLAAALLVGWGSGQDVLDVIDTIGAGFGSLLGKIGLVIVLGAVLGVILEKTNGAVTLADALMRGLGKRFPALTMGLVGAIVSIPVFCDSAFIILSRLNKTMSERASVSPASLYLSLAAGLYLTHNLVPPTPGPVTAAANLGVSQNLGIVVLLGLVVSVPVLLVAWRWSRKTGQKIVLTQPPMTDSEHELLAIPPLWRVLPALLTPIILLAIGSFYKEQPLWQCLGNPSVALLIGVSLAFVLLAWNQKASWTNWTSNGIQLAGPILIITGLGGSFGAVLMKSDLEATIRVMFTQGSASPIVLLLSAFCISALLKTAQGSSTSALVVGSAVLAPVAASIGFDSPLQLSLLVTTIGCGAMAVSHANDSYFWVVTQFSGLQVKDAYRSYSTMTLWMGLTGLLMCLAIFAFI